KADMSGFYLSILVQEPLEKVGKFGRAYGKARYVDEIPRTIALVWVEVMQGRERLADNVPIELEDESETFGRRNERCRIHHIAVRIQQSSKYFHAFKLVS